MWRMGNNGLSDVKETLSLQNLIMHTERTVQREHNVNRKITPASDRWCWMPLLQFLAARFNTYDIKSPMVFYVQRGSFVKETFTLTGFYWIIITRWILFLVCCALLGIYKLNKECVWLNHKEFTQSYSRRISRIKVTIAYILFHLICWQIVKCTKRSRTVMWWK